MRLRQLFESPQTAVMAFGRMNPPTIGHAKLVDAVKSQGGDPYIFLSQSQKPKTDPLAFADKLRYAKFFFPEVTIGNPEVKTIIQALQKIDALGYENLIYVAGSDRVASFEELINKYNGVEYNFKSIQVVSAGERDPDADGAEGMSASKMRAAAAANDLESFKQGVPQQEVADEMFAAVRKGMGIKELEPAESIAEDNNINVIKSLVNPAAQQRMAQSRSAKRGGKEKALANLKNAHMFDDPIGMVKAALNMGATPEEVAQNLSPKANLSNAPTSDQVANQRANDPYLQTNYSAEDVSSEDEDKFHNELDDLVHKYFGDSPDEEKMLKKYKKTNEKAPPGREDQVKALKKEFPDDEGAPYAIAWAQHNKKKKK